MAEISKPDYTYLWSSGGAMVAPSSVKIQTGWTAEVPPFQWENWSQNRQDQAIAHIMQHGIAQWDASTEYQAAKSYVTGSNGNIYRAVTTNTNNDPVVDSGTNWLKQAVLPLASASQAQAQSSDAVVLSPLQLSNSFKGSNQTLSANGMQKFPGGLIMQWGTTPGIPHNSTITVNFPISFNTTCFTVVGSTNNPNFSVPGADGVVNIIEKQASFFRVASNDSTSGIDPLPGVNWIALGI